MARKNEKPRRNEPNHQTAPPPQPQPLDCTKCEGAGQLRTARKERDKDGHFSGAEVVTCRVCKGTGKV